MNDVFGSVWYKDEGSYRKARLTPIPSTSKIASGLAADPQH